MTVTTQRLDRLRKNLLLLENDIDALGWDQPGRLYFLEDEEDTPYFMFTYGLHPVTVMGQAWERGLRFTEHVSGLCLVFEGWRHLAPEEFAQEAGFTDVWEGLDDVARELLTAAHLGGLAGVPPTDMPPNLRRETRTVAAVLRDKTTMTVARSRGDQPEVFDPLPAEAIGSIPVALFNFLQGHRP